MDYWVLVYVDSGPERRCAGRLTLNDGTRQRPALGQENQPF